VVGSTQSAADEGKILGVELLRFASALAVLVFHYQHFAFVGTVLPPDFDRAALPFYSWLKPLYAGGYYGVQVFWCISGFIFYWKYASQIVARGISGSRFFVLRFSRLYPLHFVTLLFMAGMQVLYQAKNGGPFLYSNNDLYHFALQLGMASNWGPHSGDSFNGPIWSISVEALVYAVFFASLRYISGSVVFLGVVVIAATLIQVLGISTHPAFPCMAFFYLGCTAAAVYEWQRRSRRAGIIVTASALTLTVVSLVWVALLGAKPKYALECLSPALILLCVTHVRASDHVARWLVPAGNMTYSSYLLHVPIQIAIVTICGWAGWRFPFYHPVSFLTFMGVTLFLSYWSYRLFEMPMQSLVRRHLLAARVPVLSHTPSIT
jgi:peptidoglycan/LPS O-acetylase OafA/YrhL